MEQLHMNHMRDLIHRLRAGESQRRIAKDLGRKNSKAGKAFRGAKYLADKMERNTLWFGREDNPSMIIPGCQQVKNSSKDKIVIGC